jgi:hypothetical protein
MPTSNYFMKQRLKNPGPNKIQRWPPYPRFEEPKDREKVWRYMDFTKFMWLIDQSALYFARTDTFLDKWEGAYPKQNSITHLGLYKDNGQDRIINLRKRSGTFYYISCWHLSEYESAAMWDLYKKADVGIGVQSTYQRLRDSIKDDFLTDPMHFTKVKYIDYENERFEGPIPELGALEPLFHKRKSYEHEKELRIITSNLLSDDSKKYVDSPRGVSFPVDLQTLLQNVYISPKSGRWFKELVESVLRKYELVDVPVHHTDLDNEPIY